GDEARPPFRIGLLGIQQGFHALPPLPILLPAKRAQVVERPQHFRKPQQLAVIGHLGGHGYPSAQGSKESQNQEYGYRKGLRLHSLILPLSGGTTRGRALSISRVATDNVLGVIGRARISSRLYHPAEAA